MNHPKPWKVVTHDEHGTWLYFIRDAKDVQVTGGAMDQQTALEIVRCVNAHEALVVACEAWDKHLRKLDESDDINGDDRLKELRNRVNRDRIDLTRQALTLAKEPTT